MCSQRGKLDKEEWLKEAERAYERVFGERDRIGEGRRPLTFSEIEDEAVREGNHLARRLLEGKISSAAAGSGHEDEECRCPRCGRKAKRKREEPADREVQARPGTVSFQRYRFYCSSCRRSFFPSGPRAEARG